MEGCVVTGATSMIGVAFIKECLKQGVDVLAIIRPNSPNKDRIPESEHIEVCEAEMQDYISIDGHGYNYDVFYHFAWGYTDRQGRNNAFLQTENITLTLEAVKLANRLNCKAFIGAGSQAEYGLVDDIITPETATKPVTAYGAAKLAAGNLSKVLCASLGMQHIWVRIFSVYGIYDKPDTMINYSVESFLNRKRPKYSNAEQYWDYLFEDDCAHAFYLIGEKVHKDALYCLASGNSQKLKVFIKKIRDIVSPGSEIGIGEITSQNDFINLQVDISELVEDTRFEPKVSFEDGIRKIYMTKN